MSYQISSSIFSLPVVSPGQNGSGQVYKINRTYDDSGRTRWVKSPRGFISYFEYDRVTGSMTMRIEDVDTSDPPGGITPPAGWVTPDHGGLNLITDYQIDRYGRVVRELGPTHQVQLNGDAGTTAVRQVSFTVYNDPAQEVRRATGYATGSSGGYVFKTVGTVTITSTKVGVAGMIEETIESVRANDSAPLTASEDFSDQTKWRKWSFTTSDQWGKVIEGKVYHTIPATGQGAQGTNYELVEYGYDDMNRLVRLKDETGTITRTVYDVRGLVLETWVGTDDTGATAEDPGNDGADGNNMVIVTANVYDDGDAGGNGYLTTIVQKVDNDAPDPDDRVEERSYDYQGRLQQVKGNDGTREILAVYTYDNLGRVTEVERYRDLVGAGHHLGKSLTYYDDEGRVYRTEAYGADETSGTLTEQPLTSNRWYDASGNLIKETGPNTKASVKYIYDGVERNLARYVVLDGTHSGSDSSDSSGGGDGGNSSSSGSNNFDFSSDSESSGSSPSSGSGSSGSGSGSVDSGSSGSSGSWGSSDSGSWTSDSSGSGSGSADSGSSGSSDSWGSSDSGSWTSGSSGSGSGSVDSGSSGSSGSWGSSGSGSWTSDSSNSSATDPVAPMCCCDEDTGIFSPTLPGTGQDMCSDPTPCPDGTASPYPVRYSTGELLYSVSDLEWSGFGFRWGQTRSYANRLSGDGNGLNGYRWLSKQMPYVALNQGPSGNLAAVVSGANSTLWSAPVSGGYASLFGSKVSFSSLPVAKEFETFLPDGSRNVYYSYEADEVNLRGKLKAVWSRYGNVMTPSYHGDGRLQQVTWTASGITGSFNYDYYITGVGKTGKLYTITQVLDSVNLRRVVYDYTTAGDLKEAVVEEWNGAAWVEIRRMLYRYWSSGDPDGFAHGLKLVVGPDGCRRMQAAGVSYSDDDDDLLPYSDYYFEYDEQRRVVLERVRGCSQEITYDYLEAEPQPGYAEPKKWAIQTTETRPDGNQYVVYSNRGGKPILSILKDVANDREWYSYREYDEQYRTTIIATSAAVASVSEPADASDTLTVSLHPSQGLVETFSYVPPGEPVAPGYLQSRSTQPGANSGASLMQESYSYGSHNGGSGGGQAVYPKTSTRRYISEGRSSIMDSSFDFYGGGTVGEAPADGGWQPEPNDISKDTVFLQETTQYDDAGNVILTTRGERFHDATGEGKLKPPAGTATPKGRITYMAYWPDGIGRTKVTADWGTNGGATYTRQADAAAPLRDDPLLEGLVLISTAKFADDGDANGAVDPMGLVTHWKSDAMGRRTELVENCSLSGSGDDVNRTTLFAYHSNSMLKRLTVVNSVTGDQVTEWNYGVTIAGGSRVASNALVREKVMPAGGYYRYRYNRQGQVIYYQDPNNTVHSYTYDRFGRLTQDLVSTVGSGIDSACRRIGQSYTAKGALWKVTSYVGTGSTITNQVEFKYTPWGQISEDRQAHSGAAGSTSPAVTYGFNGNSAPGSNNINPQWMMSPSGHKTDYSYGIADSENRLLGRIESLRINGASVDLASYQYCGLDRFVKVGYVQPGVDLTYINPDGGNGGDAGDPYTGWDRFGRTQDMRWVKGATTLERVLYGYNAGSQRTWREAPLAASNEDEYYRYDGAYQLVGRERGDLNVNRTAIGGVPVRKEEFDYDPIGNWQGYDVWQNGTRTLDQSRVHNTSNILTQIDGSSSLLSHDNAGNMTKCPPPESGAWNQALVLKWDAWNRLVKVSTRGGSTVGEYAYDGLARRTTKTVTGTVTHFYYNRQWRPVEEREGTSTEASCLYDWGLRYRDDLVRRVKWAQQGGSGSDASSSDSESSGNGSPTSESSSAGEVSSSGGEASSGGSGSPDFSSGEPQPLLSLLATGSSSSAPETHYALHDYYNVTAIIDESGTVQERYGYSGFGDVRFMTSNYVDRAESDYGWDLLYKAQFRDAETGYYNYGYRYYVPLLGRWINRDPIAEEGGLNLYSFVENNGVNGTDLLGLAEKEVNLADQANNSYLKDPADCGCYSLKASFSRMNRFEAEETVGLMRAGGGETQITVYGLSIRLNLSATKNTNKKECECKCDDVKIVQFTNTGAGKLTSWRADRTVKEGHYIGWRIDSGKEPRPFNGSASGMSGNISDPPQSATQDSRFTAITCLICSKGKERGNIIACVQWGFTSTEMKGDGKGAAAGGRHINPTPVSILCPNKTFSGGGTLTGLKNATQKQWDSLLTSKEEKDRGGFYGNLYR